MSETRPPGCSWAVTSAYVPWSNGRVMRRRSWPVKATSADSIAALEPVAPIAIPMSAAARGGGVVDAFADHRGRSCLRQLTDRGGLVLGAELGAHVPDPSLRGESARSTGVVAGEHGHTDALVGESADDLGDLGAQFVIG